MTSPGGNRVGEGYIEVDYRVDGRSERELHRTADSAANRFGNAFSNGINNATGQQLRVFSQQFDRVSQETTNRVRENMDRTASQIASDRRISTAMGQEGRRAGENFSREMNQGMGGASARDLAGRLQSQLDSVNGRRMSENIRRDVDRDLVGHGSLGVAGALMSSLANMAPMAATTLIRALSSVGPLGGAALAGGLVAAVVTAGPLISAGIVGALSLAIAGGGIAAALALQMDDPRIQSGIKNMGNRVMSVLKNASDQTVPAFVAAFNQLAGVVEKHAGSINQFFRGIAAIIPVIVAGVAKFTDFFLPALARFVESPLFKGMAQIFSDALGKVGAALAYFLDTISNNPAVVEGLLLAFKALLDILPVAIMWLANTIAMFGFIWKGINEVWQFWMAAWRGIASVVQWAFGMIGPIISFGLQMTQALFVFGVQLISAVWNGLWSGIAGAVQFYLGAALAFIQFTWSWILTAFQFGASVVSAVWNALWSALGFILGPVLGYIQSFISFFWQFVQSVFQIGAAFVSAVWNAFWSTLSFIVTPILSYIQSFVSFFWNFLQATFQIGTAFVAAVWNAFWGGLQFIVGAVLGAIQGAVAFAMGFIQSAFSIATNFISSAWNAAWNFIASIAFSVGNAIASFVSATLNFIQSAWATATNFISSAWNAAWSFVASIVFSIGNQIASFIASTLNFIQSIWAAATDTLARLWAAGWNYISNFVGQALNNILNFVQGVLTNLINLWNRAVQVLAESWANGWNNISRFVGQALNNILNFLQGALTNLINLWNRALQIIGTAWNSAWDSIGNKVHGAVNSILGLIANLMNTAASTITSGINNIQNLWNTAWQNILNFVSGIWDQIVQRAQAGMQKVIDVLNGAIAKINELLSKLGIAGFSIPSLGGGSAPAAPPARAQGGIIRGPGTGTSDSILARLSDHEYVVNAKATRQHLPLLEAINRNKVPKRPKNDGSKNPSRSSRGFRYGGLVDDIPGFKAGGPLGSAPKGENNAHYQGVWRGASGDNESLMEAHRDHVHVAIAGPPMSYPKLIAMAQGFGLPNVRPGSTYRPGSTGSSGGADHHSTGNAVDFMGYNQDLLALSFSQSPGIIELIHRTNAADWGIFGGGGGGSPLNEFLAKGLEWVKANMVAPLFSEFRKEMPPKGQFIGEVGHNMVDRAETAIIATIKEAIENPLMGGGAAGLDAAIARIPGALPENYETPGGSFGGIDINVAAKALEAAKSVGASPQAILALFETGIVESNFRHKLSSTDHDSIGYLQQRPSTGWPKAGNVAGATLDFLRRFKLVGSIGQSAQAVQRSAFPGKYDAAEGKARSLLASLGYTFDQGGLLQPGMLGINQTNKPEAVLTEDQWDSMGSGSPNVTVYIDGVAVAHRAVIEQNNAQLADAFSRGRGQNR